MRVYLSLALIFFLSYNLKSVPVGTDLFLNDFSVSLFLKPNQGSEVLKILPYGSPIQYDRDFLVEETKDWVPVIHESGISGYILRSQLLTFPKKSKFKILKQDLEHKIQVSKQSPHLVDFDEIVDFLFDTIKEGEYTGDEYLYLKIQAGVVLGLTIPAMRLESPLDWEVKNSFFLSRYQEYLTESEHTGVRLDENYFWKYAALQHNNKWGDYAGQQAVKFSPNLDCRSDPVCFINTHNYGRLKYIGLFPKGNKKRVFSQEVLESTTNFLKDIAHVRCYPPLPPYAFASLNRFKYRIQFMPSDIYTKMQPNIQKLEKECFPVLK